MQSVTALNDYVLCVHFVEGGAKPHDVQLLAKSFSASKRTLEDPSLFQDAIVDAGGYGIVWDDDTDLSCDELWENGTTIETPFDGLPFFSDATLLQGLSERTLRKAVAYGKLRSGRAVCKFGKQRLVTIDAMEPYHASMMPERRLSFGLIPKDRSAIGDDNAAALLFW